MNHFWFWMWLTDRRSSGEGSPQGCLIVLALLAAIGLQVMGQLFYGASQSPFKSKPESKVSEQVEEYFDGWEEQWDERWAEFERQKALDPSLEYEEFLETQPSMSFKDYLGQKKNEPNLSFEEYHKRKQEEL
ncbi:MAG: hypothetical protein AAFW84_09815 [Cyanobacteria bacterium J06635_15]